MLKGGVVVFFYVDDIVFCYRKGDKEKAYEAIQQLKMEYQMNTLGELKWFLGIHVLRDRSRRLLWLTQEAYIEKIAKQYEIDLNGRLPDTPMAESELLPTTYPHSIRPTLKSSDEGLSVRPSPLPKVADYSTMLYQRKMGSMLYAATTTRPDIAFAVSRLARFNQDPSQEHHRAADRVIQYLYGTRSRAICYGGVNNGTNDMRDDGRGRSGDEARSFICASDASFADNTADRKSSQGYIMTLFGGPIAWRANKQDTVTTSSTEAELLALSQTAKEAIFISRLFKAMTLKLNEPLIIDCDNTQTLRLIKEDTAKLITKLRHVDIHQHWLRQESAMKCVIFRWKATKEMLADGLTKALPKQRFRNFVDMIGMVDIRERLDMERRMEEMKKMLMARRNGSSTEITAQLTH
jgi:hypothetical protein